MQSSAEQWSVSSRPCGLPERWNARLFTEQCRTGDVFYWPPGHSVRVERDAELIMFSPQAEHTAVMDHILAKLT